MKVLFVCIQNAGRSQIAQVLAERAGLAARSAGSRPADSLHPVVVEALREIGVDVSGRVPRALSSDDVRWADTVVTMGCGDACPVLPGTQYEDWELADPAQMSLAEVRQLIGVIDARVRSMAGTPARR